jgi:hypothetical protein
MRDCRAHADSLTPSTWGLFDQADRRAMMEFDDQEFDDQEFGGTGGTRAYGLRIDADLAIPRTRSASSL